MGRDSALSIQTPDPAFVRRRLAIAVDLAQRRDIVER